MAARNPVVEKRAKQGLFTVTIDGLSEGGTSCNLIELGILRIGPRCISLNLTDTFCLPIVAGQFND